METNVIILGDCLDVLRELPGNSIDSVVTDPPYGLSKEPNIEEVLTKWMAGEDYTHRGGGFMGKTWDSFVPGPSVWREVYRVLKPGGHALVFAGTRTQDLMTISLRLAGFEIRDCIAYLYFSGFPKSLDVGKAFDKRAGAEREVVGRRTDGRYKYGFSEKATFNAYAEKVGGRSGFSHSKSGEITAPATPLAKKWDGWGTALKPAHEPIIVARKPLIGTVAENVERWGTGALNIDGCRIPTEDSLNGGAYARNSQKDASAATSYYLGVTGKEFLQPEGRFPANIVTTEQDAFWSKYCNVTPTVHQPIIMARKPLDGTVADNVERWGTGAINIDGCRIPLNGEKPPTGSGSAGDSIYSQVATSKGNGGNITPENGRFPANCVTTEPDAFFSKYFNITPPELSKKASKKDRNSDWLGREIDGGLVKIRSDLTESELEYVMSELERLSIQPVRIRG